MHLPVSGDGGNERLDVRAEEFVSRLEKVRPSGDGWTALCPAHEDKNPSLSITEKAERILLYCHAGCEAEAIVKAMGLALSDLFTEPKTPRHVLPT